MKIVFIVFVLFMLCIGLLAADVKGLALLVGFVVVFAHGIFGKK